VVELMGGSEDLDRKLLPHEPAILVGTQDILVSRTLNRGYAQSPFRWPIDFALLNNDAAWVCDEVQLLGEALATSTQMAAFRSEFGTFGQVPSVWMSATFQRSWLNTADFHLEPVHITLNDDDKQDPIVQKRLNARKSIQETTECTTPRECAQFIIQQHREGTLTSVIANTVARAQEIWDELAKAGAKNVDLLHSRFRPGDREQIVKRVLESASGIVVSTQVIEAGVDIDAQMMITDAAPWASLVQRFGRVNRRGDHSDGRIFWVASPQRQKGKPKTDGSEFAPYAPDEVHTAIAVLKGLTSASPEDLNQTLEQPAPYKFVLRKRDLLDLFDTTPDLAGNYIDVSRFVRSGEESNLYVAWRAWPEKENPPDKRFSPQELCPIPHFPGGNSELKSLITKGAWTWNYSGRGSWEKLTDTRRLYAGMRILLRAEAGGYDPRRGWAPESKTAVGEIDAPDVGEDAIDSDPWSQTATQTLEQHTNDVVSELQRILAALPVSVNGLHQPLETAARYHDWGKAHPIFQQTLYNLPDEPDVAPEPLLAKQKRELSRSGHNRKWFRHELASALALLQREEWLSAYIAMAHHGKVRMNIRSMPGEVDASDPDRRVARGIWHGDRLFAAHLGGGIEVEDTAIDLRPARLGIADGIRAWSDRVLDLLKHHGPFRLAYLEMLLRVADETASANAKGDRE
jgi:CRISPR-associated endonuclease/helicase Cas3